MLYEWKYLYVDEMWWQQEFVVGDPSCMKVRFQDFSAKAEGKPKMYVRLAGIPVVIWAEFCLLIWNRWLSPWS